jgi:hypothetical protein
VPAIPFSFVFLLIWMMKKRPAGRGPAVYRAHGGTGRENLEKKGDPIMMRREEFLRLHPDAKGEMVAYSKDGEKLGRITALNQDTISVLAGGVERD